MPIKSRKKKKTPTLYADMRAKHWDNQGRGDKINFHAAKMLDGSPLDGIYIQPRRNIFMKDIWFCPDHTDTLFMVQQIAKCYDVTYIEMKGTWVFVEFRQVEIDRDTELPGQVLDDRTRVRGR